MKPKRVAILGFPGAMALDIVGPLDAFGVAAILGENGELRPRYQVSIIGLKNAEFVAESGVVFKPHKVLQDAGAIDTLIVPGGVGLRRPAIQSAVASWISNNAMRIRRIASVCTGTYGVAPTGLLDGLQVTTHWRFADDLARKFPRIRVDARALYYKQGKMYTCAGITAGIDLAFALIEEDHGPGVALAVARELVVYLKRPGGQEQYSSIWLCEQSSDISAATSRSRQPLTWSIRDKAGSIPTQTPPTMLSANRPKSTRSASCAAWMLIPVSKPSTAALPIISVPRTTSTNSTRLRTSSYRNGGASASAGS
ncbi:MAG: AraC family transcriptional regulator [Candidatus Acidiferrales bacterium]